MKNKKGKLNFCKILYILMIIVSIMFVGLIYWLDVLPFEYLIKILIGLLVLNSVLGVFLMKKNIKKKIKKSASIFSVIIILIMIVASFYLYKTLGFLSSIDNGKYKTQNYSVIVLKNSKYDKIKDIKGLDVGTYINSEGYKIANNKLDKAVKVKYKKYDELLKMGEDLLSSKIEVIVLEDSMKDMLSDELDSFKDNTKTIYTFSIKTKVENDAKDVDVVSKPFNIYISGIDTYGKISNVSRSDVNIVVTINPKTKQILLTSVPRDYYVQLNGTTGNRDKITHAGLYGVEKSVSTLQDLLGIDINYYFKVNFSSVVDIVDTLGGVEVYSDYTFVSKDGYKYTKGYNKMNGKQALSFARERKAFADGDRQRGKNQQAVIAALINKCSSKNIITKYGSLLDDLSGKFQANMGQKKITSIIKMQLKDMARWTVTSFSLNGADSSDYTYTYGSQRLYVMIPYEDSITQAKQLIESVMNGKKLKGSYVEYTGSTNLVTQPNKSITVKKEQKIENKQAGQEGNQKYVIQFYNDESLTNIIKTVTVKEGDSISAPIVQEKSGFKFNGWKDKSTSSTPVLSNINSNMVIYASWTQESEEPGDKSQKEITKEDDSSNFVES